jgi:ribosomal-protein-alanine N-acetyltransferase
MARRRRLNLSLFYPMKPIPILETSRLHLRRPAMADASIIVWLCNDIRLARTMSEMPHPYTLAHAFEWIDTCVAREPAGNVRTFLIERRERPEVVGAIGLTLDEGGKTASTGYWVGCFHWGQGFATEALREVLRHGFEDLGLLSIRAWFSQGNPASGRVMARAGMKFEKTIPGGWSRDGHVTDMIYYTLSSDQWREIASCPGRQRMQRENETVH